MRRLKRPRGSGTVRARVLTIALVPSVAILVVGATVSGVLIDNGLTVQGFASKLGSAQQPSIHLLADVQNERRLTLQWMSGPKQDRSALDQQRGRTDATLSSIGSVTNGLADGGSDEVVKDVAALRQKINLLPATRQLADSGVGDPRAVYAAYNDLTDTFSATMRAYARSSPDAAVAYEELIALDLFDAADSESRGHALAAGLANQGMTQQQYHEYIHQIGAYHQDLEKLLSRMTPQEQANYQRINNSPAWKRLTDIQNTLQAQGATAISGRLVLPFSTQEWQDVANDVALQLDGLYGEHANYTMELGFGSARTTLGTSVAAGTAILLIAMGVMIVAMRISRRLVQRLAALRRDTLQLAERDLPSIVRRLRAGEAIDVENQVSWLNHGVDEIGQVANAFNTSQRMAIESTVQEAKTRQGVRSVFLNIAHRSQVMVHRELTVLDRAERSQEDPDQLELLFRLDHLATQARRNAENLIILGGERPRRQWRNPVALLEVVRGAIAETEHYARVNTGRLPEVSLKGGVVADVIHLLAELVDNATSFSPPQSHVDVHGNVVGAGVAVEIEDQGLGMDPQRRDDLNAMLREPPDFGMMTLTSESQIGLFVVSQLAARHNIRITLRDSVYGGISAVVVIPTALIADEPTAENEATGHAMQLPAGATPSAPKPRPNGSGGAGKPTQMTMNGQIPAVSPGAYSANGSAARPAGSNGKPVEGRRAVAHGANGDQPSNGRPNAAPQPGTTGANGAGGASGSGGRKAPLPQRTRQASLAPQLRDSPGPGFQAPQRTMSEPANPLPPPEHSRTTMTAFQQGTRKGRAADADAHPPGRLKGETR
jgi:hypothetical protein